MILVCLQVSKTVFLIESIVRTSQPMNQYIYRRAQNEPSNPSIFGQMLSFEIFTQSESIGSTTSVVKFSYSNSF